MPSQAAEQLAPESLVARIIAELQANPAAQQLLLRAMLTNEFLGMPARLDAIERDVADITRRVTALERIDVAALRGDSLEVRIHKWIRPFLSQKLGLRRPQTVHSVAATDTDRGLQKAVYAGGRRESHHGETRKRVSSRPTSSCGRSAAATETIGLGRGRGIQHPRSSAMSNGHASPRKRCRRSSGISRRPLSWGTRSRPNLEDSRTRGGVEVFLLDSNR